MNGASFVAHTLREMETWLPEHEHGSVAQPRRSMNHAHGPNPKDYERLNYMRALTSFSSPVP